MVNGYQLRRPQLASRKQIASTFIKKNLFYFFPHASPKAQNFVIPFESHRINSVPHPVRSVVNHALSPRKFSIRVNSQKKSVRRF